MSLWEFLSADIPIALSLVICLLVSGLMFLVGGSTGISNVTERHCELACTETGRAAYSSDWTWEGGIDCVCAKLGKPDDTG